jgi:hypothetical protein
VAEVTATDPAWPGAWRGGLTRTGAIGGTPSYLTLGQAAANKRLTTAAAVNSLEAILYKALRAQLSGVKVYKVGDEAERRVYLVGKARGGRWAGLKTTVVET